MTILTSTLNKQAMIYKVRVPKKTPWRRWREVFLGELLAENRSRSKNHYCSLLRGRRAWTCCKEMIIKVQWFEHTKTAYYTACAVNIYWASTMRGMLELVQERGKGTFFCLCGSHISLGDKDVLGNGHVTVRYRLRWNTSALWKCPVARGLPLQDRGRVLHRGSRKSPSWKPIQGWHIAGTHPPINQ